MVAFLSSLFAAIAALPKILDSIKSLAVMLEKKPSEIINESHEVIKELKNSKSKEERINAAKKLQDLLGN